MTNDDKLKAQNLRDQAATWRNRARMARQQGLADLEQQALERARKYENELAVHQEMHVTDDG